MSIAEEVERVLVDTENSETLDKDKFAEQIQQYQVFKKKLEDAGVQPAKKQFSIPLSERIGSMQFAR